MRTSLQVCIYLILNRKSCFRSIERLHEGHGGIRGTLIATSSFFFGDYDEDFPVEANFREDEFLTGFFDMRFYLFRREERPGFLDDRFTLAASVENIVGSFLDQEEAERKGCKFLLRISISYSRATIVLSNSIYFKSLFITSRTQESFIRIYSRLIVAEASSNHYESDMKCLSKVLRIASTIARFCHGERLFDCCDLEITFYLILSSWNGLGRSLKVEE